MEILNGLVTAIVWALVGPFWHFPMTVWRSILARGNVFLALLATLPALDTVAGAALWLFGASSETMEKWCYPVHVMVMAPTVTFFTAGLGGPAVRMLPVVWLSIAILLTSHLSPVYIAMVHRENHKA